MPHSQQRVRRLAADEFVGAGRLDYERRLRRLTGPGFDLDGCGHAVAQREIVRGVARVFMYGDRGSAIVATAAQRRAFRERFFGVLSSVAFTF